MNTERKWDTGGERVKVIEPILGVCVWPDYSNQLLHEERKVHIQ